MKNIDIDIIKWGLAFGIVREKSGLWYLILGPVAITIKL